MSTPLPLVARQLMDLVGFGRSVTLTSIVAGTFDPFTGGTAPATTTNYPMTALVESFPTTDMSGTESDEESVRRGDLRVTVISADVPEQPDTAWTVTIDGEVMRILEVDVVNEEIYVLRARR